MNLLQVSNLTFDPCIKVELVNQTEKTYISLISLIIGLRASKCEENSSVC